MNILFFLKPKSELAFIYDYHTLRQALEIMEHYRYTCVPILNKEGNMSAVSQKVIFCGLSKN